MESFLQGFEGPDTQPSQTMNGHFDSALFDVSREMLLDGWLKDTEYHSSIEVRGIERFRFMVAEGVNRVGRALEIPSSYSSPGGTELNP